MDTAPQLEEVLKVIRGWPAQERLTLVQEVLRTLQPEVSRPRRNTLDEALGLAATEAPPPTDEEVERMLEAHRMERYG